MTARNISVVVVDDDRAARALHAGFVAELPGFVVVGTAASGSEALALAPAADLMLLDMRLPDISGVEVLHRLRTIEGGGPDVLVISSSRDQTTVRQAMAAHLAGYLVKPFTKAALHERLTQFRAASPDGLSGVRERVMAQGEIDRLLRGGVRPPIVSGQESSGGRGGRAAALPKGLAPSTLDLVIAALDPITPRSTQQVAAECGLSSATAHRYLTHLTEVGVVDLSHRYGRRGRPQVLYRLVPEASAS
jgi:response regulator of citrate/malate metabolism